ncbi:MAG: metal-dependent transcriptional regulator [Nesterenkonia sp.]|uniref:metal-dependent transcriptional regulator n=1 Tax=Nesterenkonia marinintestina TaxID=2979865 RepID=UPI0021C08B01|nr:metal-dependent transcriptional regulator [Nesterenkonia sp. GX14115]MDO5492297.1 metal-dependent transcriptional regulator [Nesterenkonia sp.]
MSPRTSHQGRSTRTSSATTSVEDYAKAIYGLSEWDGTAVTASDLAKALGVSNPSVSTMVRKMSELGLVDHRPYAPLRLTAEGRRLALAMVRRHRLIETWLVREMGYGWDEVHDEAERLEHAVTDRFVERLDERLGHPGVDPHGDPIPTPDLVMEHPQTVLLCRTESGARVRLEQVDDSVPEALRLLEDRRLTIGAAVEVMRTEGRDVLVAAPDGDLRLSHEVAHAVRVSVADR